MGILPMQRVGLKSLYPSPVALPSLFRPDHPGRPSRRAEGPAYRWWQATEQPVKKGLLQPRRVRRLLDQASSNSHVTRNSGPRDRFRIATGLAPLFVWEDRQWRKRISTDRTRKPSGLLLVFVCGLVVLFGVLLIIVGGLVVLVGGFVILFGVLVIFVCQQVELLQVLLDLVVG